MPLPPPQPRTHLHTRDVVYRGFQRADGLWDIEAEMRDSKTVAMDIPGERTWQPGEPIHNLSIRVTIDDGFVVREIAVAMDDVPHWECPMAKTPMQTMIGCTMGAGWRHAIQRNLGGARGCTHLRELLFNMATVAFQTLPEGPLPDAVVGAPSHFVGQCLAWDVNGSVPTPGSPLSRMGGNFNGFGSARKQVRFPHRSYRVLACDCFVASQLNEFDHRTTAVRECEQRVLKSQPTFSEPDFQN